MKESTLLLLGLGYLMTRGDRAPAASKPRQRTGLRPAGWGAYLAEAGANPELAQALERAARVRGIEPSPMAARQLLGAFKEAWRDAKPHLSPMPVPHTEDQVFFSVLQITDPTLLKGAGSPNSRHALNELRHIYKSDERVLKILKAAEHIAFGTPLVTEGDIA